MKVVDVMGSRREELESRVREFAEALAAIVGERLGEATGSEWLTYGDACFLNWLIGVRCKECLRDGCMELGDYFFGDEGRVGGGKLALAVGVTEEQVESAVRTFLGSCARKKEVGACYKGSSHNCSIT